MDGNDHPSCHGRVTLPDVVGRVVVSMPVANQSICEMKRKSATASAPHLLLGIDSVLNNKGSVYNVRQTNDGLEREQCMTLMEALGWTYEFVEYHNNIGYVTENGTAVGMLGDVYKGRLDMACGRFRITPERLPILTFTYPINLSVKQVYLIRSISREQDMTFMLMPFSPSLWMFLAVSVVIITLALLLIRYMEFADSGETLARSICNTVYQMISVSTNFTINIRRQSSYCTFWVTVSLWLMVWSHVFIAYYTSELRGMLIVSSKTRLPFTDFSGFVENLRSGSYRFLTPSADWRPQCPPFEYTRESCATLFDEIFEKYPPVIAPLHQLANDTFVKQYSVPLVSVRWYEDTRLSDKYTVWTQMSFLSDVWVIKDFNVSPAAYPVSPNFTHLAALNSAIIRIFPAFRTIEHHYTPPYPKVSLIETPKTSAFTVTQLSSVFYTHGAIMVLSLVALLIENAYDRAKRKKNAKLTSDVEMVTHGLHGSNAK